MIEKIKKVPFLSKTALFIALDKNPNTLRNTIDYWIKNKTLIRIKRGFYVFSSFLDKKDNALYYSKFLATKLIEPSYLSMEFMLQEHQMLTDVVYGYSIVTLKKTNVIKNKFGVFNFSSIKKDLFTGFSKISYGSMSWYVASKAKALFDYIYFNQDKFTAFSEDELLGLRLRLEVMTTKDWKEYEKYLKKAPKKMSQIYKIMKITLC
ncbi:MAG: hypothetical protein HN846_04915 [Candidatus Pacebacteria bacterium]|jgi:predicted transcriptional regulator of viral defense system|nr:hypothetical protein [Candidatus Paceibacterota bacterium]MBT4004758.1 hypothetical protein [Candidatus Paceibacterota bacterium]MBT6899251.1 hypothetical protein [Candidatus Paceibacterota bacterium]MBT7184151.1 hypothetical protein [Candidatus Paceibacterota bacterium]MBT7310017.1 hypothetical protein [Candidatus Paceibacterota bacterium]